MVTHPQTSEEHQQLMRTVEMFEAITESQPDDYQSLEILKEAYTKLGKQNDVRRISMKLALAYTHVGQVSQAILEYEGILQKTPDDTEAGAALAELEAKTTQLRPHSGVRHQTKPPSQEPPASTVTVGAGAPRASKKKRDPLDGENVLTEVLLGEKLLTRLAVTPLLDQIKQKREASIAQGESITLVQLLVDSQLAKLDELLTIMVAKSGKVYLPLSYYDVDRDSAMLLPRDICFRSCIIPFDLISRSILIATANPFDEGTRDEIQALLDYNVFWYISPPAEIITGLRRVHGLDTKTSQGGTNRA